MKTIMVNQMTTTGIGLAMLITV